MCVHLLCSGIFRIHVNTCNRKLLVLQSVPCLSLRRFIQIIFHVTIFFRFLYDLTLCLLHGSSSLSVLYIYSAFLCFPAFHFAFFCWCNRCCRTVQEAGFWSGDIAFCSCPLRNMHRKNKAIKNPIAEAIRLTEENWHANLWKYLNLTWTWDIRGG